MGKEKEKTGEKEKNTLRSATLCRHDIEAEN